MNDKTLTVTVVGRRCVYINDYRVVGSKPYVSENLPSWSFEADINDLRYAIGRRPSSANKALQARVDVLEAEKANAADALATLSARVETLEAACQQYLDAFDAGTGTVYVEPVIRQALAGDDHG